MSRNISIVRRRDLRGVPAIDRFNLYFVAEPNSGCWLWLGALRRGGYPTFRCDQQNWAHRFAYEHFIGPIPAGLQIDHLCRVRCCVNPQHMEPVTAKVNTLRGTSVSAMAAKRTHCPAGHEYSGKNNRGDRICHACGREARRRRIACG